MRPIAGLMLSLVATFAFAQAPTWSIAQALPLSTQEIYPAAHQGRIYVAGGIAAKLGVPYFTDRVVSYDPEADSWREESSLPEALHHAALVSCQGRLLAVGGFNGGYTHIWRMRAAVYELRGDAWTAGPELPAAQAEGVLTCSPAGDVHLVTGQSQKGEANRQRSDHTEVHDHLVLRAESTTWEALAPIPTARNSATGGWVQGHLVVAGGRTASGNLATTEIYDPQANVWYEGAPMPLPQAGTASAVVGDELWVFGGEIFLPESGVFKEVWSYSLANDTWTALPELPTPRHGLGAAKIGDRIHVVGGATEPGGSGTSDAHEVLIVSP